MLKKVEGAFAKTKRWLKTFSKEERGDLGIGQIAGIVATIVIIGVVVAVITGLLPQWIDDLWTWITDLFNQAT